MNEILKGAEAAAYLQKQRFLSMRRADVEDAWITSFDKLAEETDAFVKREAKRWAKDCNGYRLYRDDFESEFRFVVWRASHGYTGERGHFFDYLRESIQNAARDMIRKAKTKKRRIIHLASTLDVRYRQMPSAEDVEASVINKITVEQMAADESLTNAERKLFSLLRDNPAASNQELAEDMGFKHREQVRRLKVGIRNKLSKYNVGG